MDQLDWPTQITNLVCDFSNDGMLRQLPQIELEEQVLQQSSSRENPILR